MLKMRLQRVGRKHDPSYRVVVTEHTRGPKSANYVEVLGNYDPRLEGDNRLKLEAERVKYWLGQGVKPSGTVHNLLVDKGLTEGKKVNVLPKRKPVEEKAEEAAPAPATEATEAPAEAEAAPADAPTEATEEPKEKEGDEQVDTKEE